MNRFDSTRSVALNPLSESPDNHWLPSPSAEEVLVLYRRICLLQAQGRPGEAASLEASEFAVTCEAYRLSPEGRELGEARLDFWLGTERKRVADAFVLAGLLAPLLADRLGLMRENSAALTVSPAFASAPSVETKRTAAAPPAVAPSITDLLDGMLAQDRSDSHARAQQRRAS